ncbi:transcription termination factor 2-like isoform X2 [Daktulosphaira vitifoliae]|uniref:transcription termination factor 2-like isoform X2 n=1 Tax=Daktulosphaira vitifoliae TaxID=58002 RepID=UPI0021AAA8F5|nr:transcription termination factor 2-like isoform X2 [Daktulosphaira vitifoliae]XP_050544349.1 transcription termination factor 2-like isoform X2 [Daktulosphaira vitifoliae]
MINLEELDMKSSRSTSSQNSRRNARKINSDSSETSNSDSENEKSFNNMDSAKAERLFSHRKFNLQKSLFNISYLSESDSILEISNKPDEDLKDDNVSRNSTSHILSDISPCKNEDDKVVKNKDNSEQLNSLDNESLISTPRWRSNKKNLFLDSSDESSKEEKEMSSHTSKESCAILESDTDDDIINSSKEICSTPSNKSCKIEDQLNDLSLIEPSSSDIDFTINNKSIISSSNKSRPFFEDLQLANSVLEDHNPISNSSILVRPHLKNKINECTSNKNIDVITLDDESPCKQYSPENKSIPNIDLTIENKSYSSLESKPSADLSKKLTSERYKSLQMEKKKLEENIFQFTKTVNKLKNTMDNANLNLLPDGGLRLKNAIVKEENQLKYTRMQLENVLLLLKDYADSPISKYVESPSSSQNIQKSNSTNINAALTKKAATNIDVQAMGDKALSTYRAQQAMTLDVLNTLHKSLESCPSPDILADDPAGLKVELMPHQKHAIAWLIWRENQKPHGGILADDMGLGKTLTMISLILKCKETQQYGDTDTDSDIEDLTDSSKGNVIKGGTLIICPSSLISQWQNEVKNKLRSRMLETVQYYGSNRETSARKLCRMDIVITTYHTVMWDYKSHQNTSPLYQIKWNRIILDEGHTIRNYKSQTSIAASALRGINRWALSGTPIHNKEADFYALLKFIKCRPFDDWAVWKRWVGNNDVAGKNRLQLLVKSLMLRRTKAELSKATAFKLPEKKFHTIHVELFKEEKEAYEKVLEFSSSLFASYLYEKAEKENAVNRGFPVQNKIKYVHQRDMNEDIFKDHPELNKLFKKLKDRKDIQAHHILVLLLRLRQLCCHPCLMKSMLEGDNLKADGIQSTEDLELIDHMSRMSIGIPNANQTPLTESNPIFNDSWISSKIKNVCEMVHEKVLDTDDKAIIVSQWPSMLQLIGNELTKYKVKTELFSGAVPIPLRNKIVTEFNNSQSGPKILLLSLTAGGVGLNLVAANHLFLVDVHWNPQLEAQACDRIYRVGQTKPVNVYKFICSNTIETTIQSIQSNKLELANNLFGGCSNVEATKITLDDLKEIFNINPNRSK